MSNILFPTISSTLDFFLSNIAIATFTEGISTCVIVKSLESLRGSWKTTKQPPWETTRAFHLYPRGGPGDEPEGGRGLLVSLLDLSLPLKLPVKLPLMLPSTLPLKLSSDLVLPEELAAIAGRRPGDSVAPAAGLVPGRGR